MGFVRRGAAALAVLTAVLTVVSAAPVARSQESPAGALVNRAVEPLVLTGADVAAWSQLPAVGVAQPWPAGALTGERTAHGGVVVAPPADARTGADPDRVAAFRWEAGGWVEVPVQVDERFPYALANPDSDFGIYSATDRELTYAWDTEAWKMTAGECAKAYPEGEAATADPVPTVDDDDEIVFMASDAGGPAPAGAPNPEGSDAVRHEVVLADPLSAEPRYVYLVLRDGGSSFTADTGYVRYRRDADADQWIDRHSFAADDPEKLGSSNTGYGPNLSGTVCDAEGTVRTSTDRFPRDGVTVTTAAYEWRASGRWMVRSMRVARPDRPGDHGPDLIDRWKGRAFQQSPDSTISLVGFEDEQVNWEANSALLGERAGPVRAIREVWGADSGTNVTKTETFYRDAVAYRYRLRVHPIPPDGLYTAWDYNAGVAVRYFNALKPEGVAIDGVNDDVGNVDRAPTGQPAFFDAPDPTFDLPSAILRWEQVSGAGDAGSLVYIFENKGPGALANPLVVPYYRDDKCLDDGTGDDPVPRPWPGEATTDARVRDGYSAAAGGVPYDQLTCDQKQGAWGAHGVHFFVTGDTDNAFVSPVETTEVDAQQWQFAVPTAAPANVGEPYAQTVRTPLRAVVVPQDPAVGGLVPGGGDDEPVPTELTVTGATAGQATDPVDLAATLTSGGDPVAGATLRFTLQGAEHQATTGDDGTATVGVTLRGPAGEHGLRVDYDGDDERAASSREEPFTVTSDDSRVTVSARRDRGTPVARVALADDDSAAGLTGRTVRILVDGDEVAAPATGEDGTAEATLPSGIRAGATIAAAFDGDADGTYAGSEAETTWDGRGAPAASGTTRPVAGEPASATMATPGSAVTWALLAALLGGVTVRWRGRRTAATRAARP